MRPWVMTALGSLAALLAAAAPAHAYVRYRTEQGRPFRWETSCEEITVYVNGFQQMTAHEVAKSVAAAAHAWSGDVVLCGGGASDRPYLEIVPTMATLQPGAGAPPPKAMYDAHNSLIFRTDVWGMSGNPDKPYAPQALAITSVFAKPDGHIVDADIEINATDPGTSGGPTWANLDPGATPDIGHGLSVNDLQNTLTHEFGHFVGLDHSCYNGGFDVRGFHDRPVDDRGQPVPDCGFESPESVKSTVMYDSAESGETKKRVLSSDEVSAMCTIYGDDGTPHACTLDLLNDGCNCAAGGRHRASLAWVAAAGAAVALWGRRRRV